jgi:peptide deformylase
MIDTLGNAEGLGLAANQVGILRRVIVIRLPEEDEPRVYVNPEILHLEGEREVKEGCLSVPGYHAFVTRAIWVKAKALDRSSRLVRLKADGLLAQALEHEIDHLNGILYLDHLKEHQVLIENQPEPENTPSEAAVV